MIAVDTSALMAVLLQEPGASRCYDALVHSDKVLISAATMAEALIVAQQRSRAQEMRQLLEDLNIRVVDVTSASAQRSARAYAQWGKRVHPAGLNYGDCFAYELAKQQDCPLLFIGNDFAKTDVKSAL